MCFPFHVEETMPRERFRYSLPYTEIGEQSYSTGRPIMGTRGRLSWPLPLAN
jgi:hypothetical protein